MILLALALCQPAVVREELALVTAYTPSIEGGGAGTGLTSTGIPTDDRPYGIAVDPSIIPYGSVVRIPGYRDTPGKGGPYWPADDTGSAMRAHGRKGIVSIDLRMRNVSSARAWGRRWLIVTIYTPDKDSK